MMSGRRRDDEQLMNSDRSSVTPPRPGILASPPIIVARLAL
jgi:hypothetical protein